MASSFLRDTSQGQVQKDVRDDEETSLLAVAKPVIVSPEFLSSNRLSHTWIFSAIAELIDNSGDTDSQASEVRLQCECINGFTCLTLADDGHGMSADALSRMLCLGYSDKPIVNDINPIGMHGCGFKSGAMRLGNDVLVLTKDETTMSAALLSRTMLAKLNAEQACFPMCTFNRADLSYCEGSSDKHLAPILKHSVYETKDELFEAFDKIPASARTRNTRAGAAGRRLERPKTGTTIIIWNLAKESDSDDGAFELDFDSVPGDIVIRSAPQNDPQYKKSLQAYCSILYLKPRMKIYINDQVVKTKLMSKSLTKTRVDTYQPQKSNQKFKITLGYWPEESEDKDNYGVVMYYHNRLIKAFDKAACQNARSAFNLREHTIGVVAICDASFLKPIHNKQDFDPGNQYRLFRDKINSKIKEYVEVMTGQNGQIVDIKPTDQWVQCDNCNLWRRLLTPRPDVKGNNVLWFCCENEDVQHNVCFENEENQEEGEVSVYCDDYQRRKANKRKGDTAGVFTSPRTSADACPFEFNDAAPQASSNANGISAGGSLATPNRHAGQSASGSAARLNSAGNAARPAVIPLPARGGEASANGAVGVRPSAVSQQHRRSIPPTVPPRAAAVPSLMASSRAQAMRITTNQRTPAVSGTQRPDGRTDAFRLGKSLTAIERQLDSLSKPRSSEARGASANNESANLEAESMEEDGDAGGLVIEETTTTLSPRRLLQSEAFSDGQRRVAGDASTLGLPNNHNRGAVDRPIQHKCDFCAHVSSSVLERINHLQAKHGVSIGDLNASGGSAAAATSRQRSSFGFPPVALAEPAAPNLQRQTPSKSQTLQEKKSSSVPKQACDASQQHVSGGVEQRTASSHAVGQPGSSGVAAQKSVVKREPQNETSPSTSNVPMPPNSLRHAAAPNSIANDGEPPAPKRLKVETCSSSTQTDLRDLTRAIDYVETVRQEAASQAILMLQQNLAGGSQQSFAGSSQRPPPSAAPSAPRGNNRNVAAPPPPQPIAPVALPLSPPCEDIASSPSSDDDVEIVAQVPPPRRRIADKEVKRE